MNLDRIRQLRDAAHGLDPLPEEKWPPSVYYRFLALLVADMNAKRFVELGTCGGGASYNVAKMNPATEVISIDVCKQPQVADVEALCPNFRFVLGDSIKSAAAIGPEAPIDVLFVDTLHTYEQASGEFKAWLPYLKPGSVVCFDDIYHQGVDRAWHEISHVKTEFTELHVLHISGSPTDGGFGAVLI